MTDSNTTKKMDDLVGRWHNAKTNADKFTNEEKQLRKDLVDLGWKVQPVGTLQLKINHGMALVAKLKDNYTFDKAKLKEAQLTNHQTVLMDKITKLVPEVNVDAYNELSKEDQDVIVEFLTIRRGMPSVELKPQSKVRFK